MNYKISRKFKIIWIISTILLAIILVLLIILAIKIHNRFFIGAYISIGLYLFVMFVFGYIDVKNKLINKTKEQILQEKKTKKEKTL